MMDQIAKILDHTIIRWDKEAVKLDISVGDFNTYTREAVSLPVLYGLNVPESSTIYFLPFEGMATVLDAAKKMKFKGAVPVLTGSGFNELQCFTFLREGSDKCLPIIVTNISSIKFLHITVGRNIVCEELPGIVDALMRSLNTFGYDTHDRISLVRNLVAPKDFPRCMYKIDFTND